MPLETESTRILAIDKDTQHTRMLGRLLFSEGFEVIDGLLSQTTVDAYGQEIAEVKPNIIFIDPSDLGVRPGLIRDIAQLPMIVLSRERASLDIVYALDNEQADDYVVKPVSVDELVARTRVLLRKQDETQGPNVMGSVIRYEDIGVVIDLNVRRASRDNKFIQFTKKEWSLLSILARNSGRVITYESLYTQVWGKGFDHNAQIIRTWIYRIRKKFNDGYISDVDVIQTVEGVGISIPSPGKMAVPETK